MPIQVEYKRKLQLLLIVGSHRGYKRELKEDLRLLRRKVNTCNSSIRLIVKTVKQYKLQRKSIINNYNGLIVDELPDGIKIDKYEAILPILEIKNVNKDIDNKKFDKWMNNVNEIYDEINEGREYNLYSSRSQTLYSDDEEKIIDAPYVFKGRIPNVKIGVVSFNKDSDNNYTENSDKIDDVSFKLEKLLKNYGVDADCRDIIYLPKLMRHKHKRRSIIANYKLMIYIHGLVPGDEDIVDDLNKYYTKLPVLVIDVKKAIRYSDFTLWIKPFYDEHFKNLIRFV